MTGSMPDDGGDENSRQGRLGESLGSAVNGSLLRTLDEVLVELEKRLNRYARHGSDLLAMADEGLILAVRSRARLSQSLSAAQHAVEHLQLVGVGDWKPSSTRPAWNQDSRITTEEDR